MKSWNYKFFLKAFEYMKISILIAKLFFLYNIVTITIPTDILYSMLMNVYWMMIRNFYLFSLMNLPNTKTAQETQERNMRNSKIIFTSYESFIYMTTTEKVRSALNHLQKYIENIVVDLVQHKSFIYLFWRWL